MHYYIYYYIFFISFLEYTVAQVQVNLVQGNHQTLQIE